MAAAAGALLLWCAADSSRATSAAASAGVCVCVKLCEYVSVSV